MMWKDFRLEKPKETTIAVVFNEKGFMSMVMAIYHPHYDVWQEHDPGSRTSYTLEVTHYFEIHPEPKRI